MFTTVIVKQVLESALISQKDDTFKYINLNDRDIEQFANSFLEERPDRVSCVGKDDVYLFLDEKLKAIGYIATQEGVFIYPRALSDRNYFLEYFNNWMRVNPNSTYLIPYCHRTNLEILESLISVFRSKLDRILLERLSLDLQSVITDASYNSYEKEYEHYILTLLSECTSGYIFSNILKVSNSESLKRQIYDIISCSSNRGAISIEVVSNLGVEYVPSNVLQSYVEFVNPSSVSIDTFLSILNTVPLTNFTIANLDTSNPVFNKYVAFIEHYIQSNNVTEELIRKMIQASSPDSPNGWTILNLLNKACSSFSNQNSKNITQPTPISNVSAIEFNNQVEYTSQPPMVNPTIDNDNIVHMGDTANTASTCELPGSESIENTSQPTSSTTAKSFFIPQEEVINTLGQYKQFPFGESTEESSFNKEPELAESTINNSEPSMFYNDSNL